MLFVVNNKRETELLLCGLKLLIERETNLLGVRGGVTNRNTNIGITPEKARGDLSHQNTSPSVKIQLGQGHDIVIPGKDYGEYASSENEEGDIGKEEDTLGKSKNWLQTSSRNHLCLDASKSEDNHTKEVEMQGNIPLYLYGQQIWREIATNIELPLPLPFCRALLLDSSSPLIMKWEKDKGDTNYCKTPWTFTSSIHGGTDRNSYTHEHDLIASGTMVGGYRTTSFDRIRNGQILNLSESQTVSTDDDKLLIIVITEELPRRGFSVKIKIILNVSTKQTCVATIVAELCALGKNMTNQVAVHKALLLVIDELKARYGEGNKGECRYNDNLPMYNSLNQNIN